MTGEGDIEDGCAYTIILHYVNHLRYEWSCLPRKSRTWFKYDMQPWIALLEIFQQVYHVRHIVVVTRHEVTATKVYPIYLRKP